MQRAYLRSHPGDYLRGRPNPRLRSPPKARPRRFPIAWPHRIFDHRRCGQRRLRIWRASTQYYFSMWMCEKTIDSAALSALLSLATDPPKN